LPEKGKLTLVENISLQIGGCAANFVIVIARLGLKATVIGKIRDDNFGKFIHDVLDSEKVDATALTLGKNISTSASTVMTSGNGQRSIIHSFGANASFNFDDIHLDVV
jgi:ribokinase